MRCWSATLLGLGGLLAAVGCEGAGASPKSGIGGLFSVSGAQYIPGELTTAPMADAPTMQTINLNTVLFPGAVGRPLGGSGNGSSSVLVGMAGDIGHWVLPTGIPDAENPGAFAFQQTTVSLAPQTPLDPPTRDVIFRAVDEDGNIGPAMILSVRIQSLTLSTTPASLRVTLTWDTEADLDLKLRVPVPNPTAKQKPYVDVWSKFPVALPPVGNGAPAHTAAEIDAAGKLDFDSNAQCAIDGRLQENITFPQTPPSGDYEVRVDATSLCGQVAAQWHAVVFANDVMVGQAYGQVGDIDTQVSHGPATGTLAITFSVP